MSHFFFFLLKKEQTKITGIEGMLLNSQLCWAGHNSRMENHHLPWIILYSEFSASNRCWGAQCSDSKTTWKNLLVPVTLTTATLAENSDVSHNTNHVVSFENTRWATLNDKICSRRNRNTIPSNPDQTLYCDRTCLSHIGLINHERACSRRGPLLLDLRFPKSSHDICLYNLLIIIAAISIECFNDDNICRHVFPVLLSLSAGLIAHRLHPLQRGKTPH